MPDPVGLPVEVRQALLGQRHSCIDWQWASGRVAPHCRRNKSCGAAVPDSCPLAQLREEHMTELRLVAYKDHPLGGFRVWRKGDLFHAEIMDDPDTLTENPQWDLENWIANLPSEAALEAMAFRKAEDIYPTFYRMSESHHGAWNVCQFLQSFLSHHTRETVLA